MPWKLIFFLLGVGLAVVFSVLNIGNNSDISLGVRTFQDVPIFMSLFVAFFMGSLITLPFALSTRRKKDRARKERDIIKQHKKESREGRKNVKGKKGRGLLSRASKAAPDSSGDEPASTPPGPSGVTGSAGEGDNGDV